MLLPASLFALTDAPADVIFRPATLADARRLHEACYSERPFPRFQLQFARRLEKQKARRGLWLIAERKGAIVGSGQLVPLGAKGEIADLSVTAVVRGQGVGSAIVTILTNAARYLEMAELEIGVLTDNERALALYQRLGFAYDRRVRLPAGQEAIVLYKTLA